MFKNKVKSIVLGAVVVAAFSITAAAVGGNMIAQNNGGTSSMTNSDISAVSDTVNVPIVTSSASQVDSTVPSSEPPASSQASSSSEASSSKPEINGTINSDGLIVQASIQATQTLPDPAVPTPHGNPYPDTEAGN